MIKYLCLLISILFGITYQTCYAATLECPNARGSTNGGHSGQFGPFDYRDPANRIGPSSPLHVVEIYHFTTGVATLTKGESSSVTGDLSYTLRAFPNHHRALQSLADLGIQAKRINVGDLPYSIPCFFIRAKNYSPTDGMVDAVYAYYLANMNQKDLARIEADLAIKKADNNPRIYYDSGLAYYYIGEFKKAKECSEMAKKLGSTAVGLDTLLSKVNVK